MVSDNNFVDNIQSKENHEFAVEQKAIAWTKIHSLFNSQSDVSRTIKQLSTLWRDMKQRAKKVHTSNKQERLRTGGGTAQLISDPVSESMISLLPSTVLDPITNINDSDTVLHDCVPPITQSSNLEENEDNIGTSSITMKENISSNSAKRRKITESDVLEKKMEAIDVMIKNTI